MIVYVDADACPNVIKDILFKAANKRELKTVFVANQFIKLPPSRFLSFTLVKSGFDVADNHIVDCVQKGDLVITADIPLASQTIEKGGFALNPRGTFYTVENIGQTLSIRNFMQEQRDMGLVKGGPPSLAKQDVKAFADAYDKFCTKHHTKSKPEQT